MHRVAGDPGGTTKWGIAQAFHPNVDVSTLTEEQAIAIAKPIYWHGCRCDDLPYPMDVLVWDAAFNMGVARGGRFLQRALRAIGVDIEYANHALRVDGAIGPATVAETVKIFDYEPKALPREYALHRLRFYNRAITGAPTKLKFIGGWMNRVFDLLNHIGMHDFNEPY